MWLLNAVAIFIGAVFMSFIIGAVVLIAVITGSDILEEDKNVNRNKKLQRNRD